MFLSPAVGSMCCFLSNYSKDVVSLLLRSMPSSSFPGTVEVLSMAAIEEAGILQLSPEPDAPPFSKLMSLPREIRDNIYSFATSTHTTKVLVEPHVFTHVLFESLPFPALLRVNHQVREEVFDAVVRDTRATMLDAWDCRGADSFKNMSSVPQPILERIRFGEIALNTWSPVENDIGIGFLLFMKVQDLTISWLVCVEALLSYVTGIRELRILFNDSTLGKEKLKQLQEHKIVRTTGIGPSNKHEIRFIGDGEDGDFKERVCIDMALIGSVC